MPPAANGNALDTCRISPSGVLNWFIRSSMRLAVVDRHDVPLSTEFNDDVDLDRLVGTSFEGTCDRC